MHSRPFLYAFSLTLATAGVAVCLIQSLRAEATPKPAATDIKLERVPPVEADKALKTLQIADGFRIDVAHGGADESDIDGLLGCDGAGVRGSFGVGNIPIGFALPCPAISGALP